MHRPRAFKGLTGASVALAFVALAALSVAVESPAQESDTPPAETAAPDEPRRVRRLGDTGERPEWRPQLAPPPSSAPRGNEGTATLPDPEQQQALQGLLGTLAVRPGDPDTLAALEAFLARVVAQAGEAMDAGEVALAGELLTVVAQVDPRTEGLSAANRRYERMLETRRDVERGRTALSEGRLVEPAGTSAAFYFSRALEAEPGLSAARQGLLQVQQGLIRRALDSARDLDFEGAQAWLEQASAVREPQELVEEARAEVDNYLEQRAAALEQQAIAAMDAGDFDRAEFILIDLVALGGQQDRIVSLRERIGEARLYGGLAPGQVIQDRLQTSEAPVPALVVIPAGSFFMGSEPGEPGHQDDQWPVHRVSIARGFALGRTEVTVAQFRGVIEATGYRTTAQREGRSTVYDSVTGRLTERPRVDWSFDYRGKRARDELPVVHVSWRDAQAYVDWLARETGKPYRLPTEAEFEYALRAGTTTAYWWGEASPPEVVENLTGDGDKSPDRREWSTGFEDYDDGHWGPSPAGSLGANPFGLHDIGGNVAEWVTDCWHDTYVRAPTDGSAWVNPGCRSRVVRGGHWAASPAQVRSAFRLSALDTTRGPIIGFRVARDL